jgi:uncharacterized protein YcbK (DUF882 family)
MANVYPRYNLTRRAFLVTTASFAASCALFGPTRTLAMTERPHPLSLYNTHTGECLEIQFQPRLCDPQTLQQLNHFLRDFRTGEVHPIDTKLFSLLCMIQQLGESSGTYEIISGYRSKATNAKLRKSSSGVAKKSLHMTGRAIDVRLSDLKTTTLRDLACSLKSGGVGYYSQSDFVHIDTGRVRTW